MPLSLLLSLRYTTNPFCDVTKDPKCVELPDHIEPGYIAAGIIFGVLCFIAICTGCTFASDKIFNEESGPSYAAIQTEDNDDFSTMRSPDGSYDGGL